MVNSCVSGSMLSCASKKVFSVLGLSASLLVLKWCGLSNTSRCSLSVMSMCVCLDGLVGLSSSVFVMCRCMSR